ncbi:PREDICTED: SH3 and multiple ankyrin repeat domains protein 2 [Myotis brandtii]|uniref:SH3 and multiple ankyrin repeat domains protein 2 n=1 Tax=Myotis brandtii TaxID=109478 RepID=UPI0007044AB6|nr:PREDICTED: SH3 and multiple ankyrin repeat domains protein 2 [Myotis brandtii]
MSVPGGAAATVRTGPGNGRCPRNSLHSDCTIEEKAVVLQKKDNEGFGFVLRGAKADTPIEEFTPTPAFPALQYLESVDEGGVAWQAGLRTGDFLIEVNSENVVKVGHRQVVNMIRQGGNHLVLKVVTVTRSLDPDDTTRKKGDCATTGEGFPVAQAGASEAPPVTACCRGEAGLAHLTRVASGLQSVYERQGIAVMTPTVPGSPKGPFLGLPRGTMRRQKSIDSRLFLSGITEEERQFLAPPMLKFTRSLSMPDTSEDSEDFLHPLTGRLLDPSSPLALALSARDRAMKEAQQGPKGEAPKADLNKPLYIDTKMRPSMEAGLPTATRQGARGPLRRQETENKYESGLGRDRKGEDRKNMLIDIMDTSQQKSAGLLMVHTVDAATPGGCLEEGDENRIPPPPLASVDLDEDFAFTEPLPPPLEFANSFDIPDDRIASVPALTGLAQQDRNDASCLPAPLLPPPESFDTVTDSGIEEADSRSGSDHPLETTSTVSTVSSISTLSSEGGESVDTCTVYADGQAFVLDKPPVPPKPKVKPVAHKSNVLYQDTLAEEDSDGFIPPPAPPPPPGGVQPGAVKGIQPRTSKLWGDVSEVRSPILSGPKANVISELNSILQQMNREKLAKPGEGMDAPTGTKPAGLAPRSPEVVSTVSGTRSTTVTFTVRPGTSQPITLQSRPPDYDSRTSGTRRAPSPVVSPTEMTSPSVLPPPLSGKPFTTKPVHLWTKPDVGDWLESLNLGEHKDTFLDNEIDGSHLPNLQKEDLIDLGVTRVGHRMNIERALKQLLDR